MKRRCDHSYWLNLYSHGSEIVLSESDRLRTLTKYIPFPEIQKPSLIVLIGNVAKSVALRELFGVKRVRRFRTKRTIGELHLHLDPSTIFTGRPIFLADGDFPNQSPRKKSITEDDCHETTRRTIQWVTALPGASLSDVALSLYTHLLPSFADTFCFFSTDLGGFRQIAIQIAAWLEKSSCPTLPKCLYPRVIIVSDKIPRGSASEKEARKTFLWILNEETTRDPFEHFSEISVVSLFPTGVLSVEARYRSLKERLMEASNYIRKNREDTYYLFSAAHFNALFGYACAHLAETIERPFNFIEAARKYNPVALDLEEHLSRFLKYIKNPLELIKFGLPMIASSFLLDNYPPGSHMFDPTGVFKVLYRDVLHRLVGSGVMVFQESSDVILRSGFIKLVEKHLLQYFSQLTRRHGKSSSEIHQENLELFSVQWGNIRSDSTCFTCLRRRPQYSLRCGHCVCHTCVKNFGYPNADDPWIFEIRRCFLCNKLLAEVVVVKDHPPTSGAGVLCIDGGGVRGIIPLMILKRIQERIGLPIPFQNFIKVAFGVSSGKYALNLVNDLVLTVSVGGLIILDIFLNGHSAGESAARFEELAKVAFLPWKVMDLPLLSRFGKIPFSSRLLKVPLLSRLVETSLSGLQTLLISYFADGLYPAKNIDAALREAFGTKRSILDYSYRLRPGQGSVYRLPQSRRGRRIKSSITITALERTSRIKLWKLKMELKIYQSGKSHDLYLQRLGIDFLSFFPPKKIHGVGTFQDAGPLENDPLISALSEGSSMFPLAEEPDFVVSLGTGEPKPNSASSTVTPRAWKNKALPRLCRLLWEKMRDKKTRQAFEFNPRYYRLDVEFDQMEPRLDDAKAISDLKSKVNADDSLTKIIDSVARCMLASLFYFELESIPERVDGKFMVIGHIQCSLRRSNFAFPLLLHQLSDCSAMFHLNEDPIPDRFGDISFLDADGNFRKRIELATSEKFSISLKQGHAEPCNISGSPYSVSKLIQAQSLDAYLGTPNHRKRNLAGGGGQASRKRQRMSEVD